MKLPSQAGSVMPRLATQNAIERSRESLAETRAALVAMKLAHLTALRRKVQKQIYALKPPTTLKLP